jgi:hypothetical protein
MRPSIQDLTRANRTDAGFRREPRREHIDQLDEVPFVGLGLDAK